MSDDVEFSDRGLKQLIKALKDQNLTIEIGILGDKNARSDSNSNAEIGAKHEFGNEGMPQRSFLRMPLIDNMQKYLDNAEMNDPDAIKKMIKQGRFIEWAKKIGILAEAIISDGFNTGGFGKWKPSNMKYKKNHQTLVETQQLRNSITSRVKE